MKNDQYIPHEVSTRNSSQVINLIEAEGASGYGFYWAILEYLRSQDRYIGDIRAIKNLARQLKVRIDKALRVLNDYGLFVVDNFSFHSPMLNDKMLSFDRKRAQCEAYKRRKDAKLAAENVPNVSETSCNSLEISSGSDTINNKQPLKQEQPLITVTSSSDEEDSAAEAAAQPLSRYVSWEDNVDALRQEQGWLELMAMQSGLRQDFYALYPKIVDCFKRHVRSLGKESRIMSLGDAKQYFCFFLKPGSRTFDKMMTELRSCSKKDPYRFERRDPATGERSYCGVPIPEDAPPRPNDQAAWCNGKWVY